MKQVQLFASALLGLFTASLLFIFRSSDTFAPPGFNLFYPMLMARKPTVIATDDVADDAVVRQFRHIQHATPVDLMTGKWIIFVYAPWCPHSQRYRAAWQGQVSEAEEAFSLGNDISVATLSLDENPALATWLGITALPSVLHIQDGKIGFRNGSMQEESMHSASRLSIWQLRLYSAFGRVFVGPQARTLEWLKEHRKGFYSVAAAVIGIGLASLQ